MNILIAADIFPPDVGGPATYSARLLEELVKNGDQVTLVTHTPQTLAQEPSGVVRVAATGKLKRYVAYVRLLKRHICQSDVVYAMGPVNAGFPAWLLAWRFSKPLVCKVVGDYAWEQGVARYGVTDLPDAFQKKRYGGLILLLRLIERLVCRRAAAVVVPSNYLKKIVMQWGVHPDNIYVIPNISQHSVSAAPSLDVSVFASKRVIFSAGRLMPWKGMKTLIEVMASVLQIHPDAHLVIAGDGHQRDEFVTEIKKHKLEQAVTLLGAIPPADMSALFKRASLFVLNSGYEGMPHVVLEAFEAGCPIAVSRAGGNPELVSEGVSGLLFEYNNKAQIEKAINALLSDTSLREQCVTGGKEKLAQLSAENPLIAARNLLERVACG